MYQKKNVLVTGGSGMIGKRVVKLFAENDWNVASLDILPPKENLDDNVRFFQVDICSSPHLNACLLNFKPNIVIHLAAVHHIPTCEVEREYCQRINIEGTETLLKNLKDINLSCLFLASSGAVYEDCENKLTEEITGVKPSDNYSLTKLCNEYQVQLWSTKQDTSVVIGRIFNTVASDDTNAHLIPDMVNQVTEGYGKTQTIRVGNVSTIRDYTHADDVAESIYRLCVSEKKERLISVNICSGIGTQTEEVIKKIGKFFNIELQLISESGRMRQVDKISQIGDNKLLESLVGWTPQRPFDEILKMVLEPTKLEE